MMNILQLICHFLKISILLTEKYQVKLLQIIHYEQFTFKNYPSSTTYFYKLSRLNKIHSSPIQKLIRKKKIGLFKNMDRKRVNKAIEFESLISTELLEHRVVCKFH
jgi:hypothetical protein